MIEFHIWKKKTVARNATSLAILRRILAQVKWDIRLEFAT